MGYFKFGSTKLSDIAPHDLKFAKHPEAFVVLRAFFNWARSKSYVQESPMERMKAPAGYKARKRVLTDDELKKIWNAAGDDTYGRIVKLLMLTGQRRGEIAGLTEKMMGEDTITLPPALTKNSREHTFPLGPEVRAVLKFPLSFAGWSKAKERLDKASGVSGWTLHDLRRTFRTNLGKLGVRPDIAERLVNHINARSDMEETYDRYSYLPEMRAAVLKWEAYVLKLRTQETPEGASGVIKFYEPFGSQVQF